MQRFYRDLPVLVTGGTGFIGTHLVERLAALGARLRCLVRRTSRLEALPPGVELVYGELAEGRGIEEAVRGAQVIFHLAGVTKALRSEDYERGNVRATENLLAAVPPGARLVHVSSLAAVGPSRDGAPLRETAAAHPVSHYGRSKLRAEWAVRESTAAARAVIVRPPVVFGPRDTDVLELFRMIARGWMFAVGNPEAKFSLIYVRDLVDGLLAAGSAPQAAGRTYFLAAEAPVSWREFAQAAGGLLGRRPRVLRIPWPAAWLTAWGWEVLARRRGRAAIVSRDKIREARHQGWVCDVSLARDQLGFRALTPLEEALRQTLAWYRRSALL